MSGALVGSGLPPPIRVGARNHCMHSMYRAGVPVPESMLRQPIHFAPGAMPIWLPVPSSPIVVPVVWCREAIVAGKRRIIPARIADAVMDGIMPVVIVIGVLTVPTAVMRLQCVMRPANAGIRAGYNNILSGKTQRPYLGRMRVIDARFDSCRSLEMRRRLVDSLRLRKMILDVWIAFYPRHVGPRR